MRLSRHRPDDSTMEASASSHRSLGTIAWISSTCSGVPSSVSSNISTACVDSIWCAAVVCCISPSYIWFGVHSCTESNRPCLISEQQPICNASKVFQGDRESRPRSKRQPSEHPSERSATPSSAGSFARDFSSLQAARALSKHEGAPCSARCLA
jgi:hypothetical protein